MVFNRAYLIHSSSLVRLQHLGIHHTLKDQLKCSKQVILLIQYTKLQFKTNSKELLAFAHSVDSSCSFMIGFILHLISPSSFSWVLHVVFNVDVLSSGDLWWGYSATLSLNWLLYSWKLLTNLGLSAHSALTSTSIDTVLLSETTVSSIHIVWSRCCGAHAHYTAVFLRIIN